MPSASTTRGGPEAVRPSGPVRWLAEWVPPAAVIGLGAGTLAALSGAVSGNVPLAIGGIGLAAMAIIYLMAGQWVDPLVALVLTLPLPALYSTSAIRLAPAAPVTTLVIIAWVLGWPGRRRILRPARLPVWTGVLLLGAFGFAGILTPHRADALREILNLGVLLVLLALATDLIARVPERTEHLVRAIAAVAAVSGGLAVLETVGVLPGRFPEPSGFNRAALGFGQPNGLGMFLALSLPFVVHVRAVAENRAARWGAGLALAATVAGLIGTFSRGSWLSVLAGAAILPLAGRWRSTLRIWSGALLFAIAVDVLSGGAVREALFGLLRDWSVAQRAALMLAGVHMFLEQPLVGVGPGGFAAELERVGALVPQLWDLETTPHNAYIQVAAETGMIGLAAFGVFLVTLFRQVLRLARAEGSRRERSLHAAVFWAFAIVLAEGMVEWPFSHGHGQLVMLIAALGCALPLADRNEDDRAAPWRDLP